MPGETTPPSGADASDAAWPQLGRTAGHAGFTPSVTVGDPDRQWAVEMDGILTTPTVAAGTVYVTRGKPTGDGPAATLEAYRLADGTEQWTRSLGSSFEFNAPLSNHRPAYHRGTLYVTAGDGVVAVDAESGDRYWRATPVALINDPPVVTDTGVYITAFQPTRLVRPAHDGRERWRYPSSGTPTEGDGAVVGDRVYTATRRDGLACLDASDGRERWLYDGGVSYGTSLAATDEYVVHHGAGPVEAVRPDGSSAWQSEMAEASVRPAIAEETAYVATLEGYAVAFDLETGEERWRNALEPFEYAQGTIPVVTDDALLVLRVGEGRVTVYALERSSGDVAWRNSRSADGTDSTATLAAYR
jgi:outer membrane protein assembly factor BamB